MLNMTVRLKIVDVIEQVAAEHKKPLQPLTDDLVLLNSGLDSLCFAILVARLEDELGVDPFTAATDAYFPVTLADLVQAYDRAAA
jgi:acyl carrier protein